MCKRHCVRQLVPYSNVLKQFLWTFPVLIEWTAQFIDHLLQWSHILIIWMSKHCRPPGAAWTLTMLKSLMVSFTLYKLLLYIYLSAFMMSLWSEWPRSSSIWRCILSVAYSKTGTGIRSKLWYKGVQFHHMALSQSKFTRSNHFRIKVGLKYAIVWEKSRIPIRTL